MALNTLKCNHLMPLPFKGLTSSVEGTVSGDVDVVAELTARVRPDVQVVDVGQSATFVCVISGSPAPSIVWYKDGAPINTDDDDRVTLSDDRRQLSVRQVLRQHAGIYQCLVENSDDSQQSSGRLIIGGRPAEFLISCLYFLFIIHT